MMPFTPLVDYVDLQSVRLLRDTPGCVRVVCIAHKVRKRIVGPKKTVNINFVVQYNAIIHLPTLILLRLFISAHLQSLTTA